jgi:signal transduction histidine kinase
MSPERLPEYPDAILRGMWDLAFLISRDGTYLDYHYQDEQQLYAPPEAFIGRRIREIMPAALAEASMAAIERACATGETVVLEYDLPLPSGETRFFQASIVDAGHERALSIVRDVTESRRARELTYSLAGRVIANHEAERARIARELHDNIGQRLASLTMEIERTIREALSPTVRANLQALTQRSEAIVAEVAQLSRELHPPTLDALGLASSLKALCADMGRKAGIEIPLLHRGVPEPLDWRVAVSLYRIAQEALHNIVRHSRASAASVQLLGSSNTLALYVADAGVGFDAAAAHKGIGLASMRERVEFLSGALVVHTAKGAGTRIAVRIPLNAANRLLPLRTDTRSNSIRDLLDGSESGGSVTSADVREPGAIQVSVSRTVSATKR